MNKKIIILVAVFFMLLSVNTALAQLNLPPGLQAIEEYNQQYAIEFLYSISIPLVFLAGILSFISPCILPLIPAFFSYTFKEKKGITKMTLIFFFGFSIIFVLMGIIAAYLGQSLVMLQGSMIPLVMFAGLFLILFGLLAFLGRGLSSIIKINRKTDSDTSGIFLMGIFFAIGWSACLGPIIGGILLMVSVIGNIGYAAILLFVYSLGILTPLFILSLLYDRFNLGNNKWIKGKEFRFRLLGKDILTHSTEMISGVLLIGLGLIFILFGGTSIINSISPIGSSLLFNDLQSALLNSPAIATVIGLIVLVLLVALISIKMFRKNRRA